MGASKGAGTIRDLLGVASCTSGMPDVDVTYSGWSSGSAVAIWHPFTGSNPIGLNPILSTPTSTPKDLQLSESSNFSGSDSVAIGAVQGTTPDSPFEEGTHACFAEKFGWGISSKPVRA